MAGKFNFRFWVILILIATSTQVFANNKTIQNTIHLLDYISRDYAEAVSKGEIINQDEYSEMQEFADKVIKLTISLELEDQNLLSQLDYLRSLIINKATVENVSLLATSIRKDIIRKTEYEVAPFKWPDIEKGKLIYQRNCSTCHGDLGAGDGILAKDLEPKPTIFKDQDHMKQISPFQIFNTVKLGVEGTSMTSFSFLSDEEVWDLAFFVKSFAYELPSYDNEKSESQFNKITQNIDLSDLASKNDIELRDKISVDDENGIDFIRTFNATELVSRNNLHKSREFVNASYSYFKKGDFDKAREKALLAYLEGVEPVESRIKANDPDFLSVLERGMFVLREKIENNEDVEVVKEARDNSLALIDKAEILLQSNKMNYWLAFTLSGSIMLREGLEAFLIISLIITLIGRMELDRAKKWVHAGWLSAVLFGVIVWFFSDWVVSLSGKNREIMEGVISLIAVVILAFAGFWLHGHSNAKKWQKFVNEKITSKINSERMLGLTAFSFLVVFREAFESVLFLQAINIETAPDERSSIFLGVLAAFALIGILSYAFTKYSKKLPIRQLFKYSSWMITLLAVILLGKGLHSIQEAGIISISQAPFNLGIDWLGIYPTIETIIAQAILLIAILVMNRLSLKS